MKIISSFRGLFIAGARPNPRHESESIRWVIDPLSHPALDIMSERELADMPFRLTARRTDHEIAVAQAVCGGCC